jgi:hypothetical protein
MSDSEKEVEIEMTEEEKTAAQEEERAQIWQCFSQYDYDQ